MKVLKSFLSVLFVAGVLASCSAAKDSNSEIESGTTIANGVPSFPVNVSIEGPRAGVDFPTDSPVPTVWKNASVLVMEQVRVRAPKGVTLSQPVAGVDYPTDRPLPLELRGRKILVLDQHHRLPLLFGKDSRGKIYLGLKTGQSFAIKSIASIEKAEPGVDFPTDMPQQTAYVIVLVSGERVAIP